VVAAVVQDRQQSRQALDHLTGLGEEHLRHHHALAAPDRDQMAIAELLVDLGYRDFKQFGDPREVVDRLVGI